MRVQKPKELAEKVLRIINTIPETSLEKLMSIWDSGGEVSKHNLAEILGISGQKIYQLSILIADPSIDHHILHAMFITCLETKHHISKYTNRLEIVWTGPGRINTEVRSTKPVIEEMLKSAKPREKITIIDYRITSNAKSIVKQLNSCLSDGVEIDLIVDKSNVNKNELKKCFAETSLTKPTIYTRKEKESKFYKVHAKVIIIQDRQMLVTSANLTELGTEVNFEIGLLVNGPIVKEMTDLITRMIKEKYFEGDDDT